MNVEQADGNGGSKRRRDGAGYSVPAAADEIGVSYKTLREAIAMKQVRTIKFGGWFASRERRSRASKRSFRHNGPALSPRGGKLPGREAP